MHTAISFASQIHGVLLVCLVSLILVDKVLFDRKNKVFR